MVYIKFANQQKLKKNIDTVHEGIKPFKCSVCDVKFANKEHLKKHIETIHEEIKPFKCTIRISYCTQFQESVDSGIVISGISRFRNPLIQELQIKFANRQNLKKHRKTVNEGIKTFT